MKTTLFVLPGVLAALIATFLVMKKLGMLRPTGIDQWPFYAKRLLSQPEQLLYHRLVAAMLGPQNVDWFEMQFNAGIEVETVALLFGGETVSKS